MADGDVVVITGGAGFLGQHLIHLLQEKTSVREIRVFDVKEYQNEMGHVERISVTTHHGDVRKQCDLEQAFRGADLVFHLASMIEVAAFPDYKLLEEINVTGTANVIRACVKENVFRLVYTSTLHVALDKSWDDVWKAVETRPYPHTNIFEGYGGSKKRAEQLVLAANGTPLNSGEGQLRTLSVRPTSLYGEHENYLFIHTLRAAAANKGRLLMMSDGGVRSTTYVGNTMWAHIVASQALKTNGKVGGEAFFITDDTPVAPVAELVKPLLDLRGFTLSKFTIPFWIAYVITCIIQLCCILFQPFCRVGPQLITRSSLKEYKRNLTFSRQKAEELLRYEPLFTYKQSMERSSSFYSNVKL